MIDEMNNDVTVDGEEEKVEAPEEGAEDSSEETPEETM